MNHKLFFPLMICALLLAGCYRQAADSSHQQVNSRGVEEIASLTAAQSASQQTATASAATSASREYLTPQPPPAQVGQPTAVTPTTVPTVTPTATTLPALEVFPTATATSAAPGEEGECVYAVQAGDTLFRLSFTYDTTVDDLMDLNELEDDALQIGQVLRLPNCDALQAAEDTETDAVGGDSAATVVPVETTAVPTPGRLIHIVASGDTVGSLSVRYDVSIEEIVSLNRLANPDTLSVGQELLIPLESPDT